MGSPSNPRPRIFDPRLGGISDSVLRNRNDRPVSVTSPVLEWSAIQLSQITSPIGRALYQWELDILTDIYQTGVDTSRIRVVEAHVLNAPTTLGSQIRVPYGWSFQGDNRPVLVHETMHVWQFQNLGTSYITDSVYHNASGQIATGNRNVAYMNYQLQPNATITGFSAEEQATIVGDYYEMTRLYQNATNPPAWVALRRPDLAIYERLIQQVRTSTPRSDQMIYQQSLMNQPQPGMDFTSQDRQMPQVMPIFQVRF